MIPATNTDHVAAAAEIESADFLLGDLDLGDTVEITEHLDELSAGDESVVEGAIARAEVYDAVEIPGGGTGGLEAPTPAKTAKAKTPKVPKIKAPRELSALPVETFCLKSGNVADDTLKTNVIALRPTQKKVGEKFDNLFLSIAAGKKPSVYTMACFNALIEKGEATSTDLVGALKAMPVANGKTKGATYDDGTARSQAGQMMLLFSVVGIATRDKQTLKLNADSTIVEKLKALAA